MSIFLDSCFREQEEEPIEENCCISPFWTTGKSISKQNATVTSVSTTCCQCISPCGLFGDCQQGQESSSPYQENDLLLCTAHLMADDGDVEEQHLGGQIESQQQLLNLLEEEKAYHQEELALAANSLSMSSSSSSSWWRCGYKPSWSSISFACGGWLQFYEFGNQ